MLKILSSGRDQKLVAAITQGDLEKLAKLLPKYKTAQLDAPLHEQQNAVELAICAGQALQIWWYPLTRDCVVYVISIIAMAAVVVDDKVEWYVYVSCSLVVVVVAVVVVVVVAI